MCGEDHPQVGLDDQMAPVANERHQGGNVTVFIRGCGGQAVALGDRPWRCPYMTLTRFATCVNCGGQAMALSLHNADAVRNLCQLWWTGRGAVGQAVALSLHDADASLQLVSASFMLQSVLAETLWDRPWHCPYMTLTRVCNLCQLWGTGHGAGGQAVALSLHGR